MLVTSSGLHAARRHAPPCPMPSCTIDARPYTTTATAITVSQSGERDIVAADYEFLNERIAVMPSGTLLSHLTWLGGGVVAPLQIQNLREQSLDRHRVTV